MYCYLIIIMILTVINVLISFFCNQKAIEVINEEDFIGIQQAKNALSLIFFNSFGSLVIGAISWMLPTSDLIKITKEIETVRYKYICIAVGVAFHLYIIINMVSPIKNVYELLKQSGYNICLLIYSML